MIFFDVYLQYLKYCEIHLKHQSFLDLKQKFSKSILPYFKDMNIYNINSNTIIDFQIYFNNLGYSFNYKRNIHFLLSGFLNYCVKFYDLKCNYCSIVGCFKKSSEIPKKMKFYTLSEFNSFINCIDNIIYKTFFEFLFFTGVRPGEAFALKFSDINGNYISITKTMYQHGNREIGTPKTRSSFREIVIDNKLLDDILKLKKNYISQYGEIYDFYVFGGIKPLSPTTCTRYKKSACKRAKINEIRLHDFRHSHATLLINNNIPISEISKRLGHSNITTTFNVYIHNNSTYDKTMSDILFNLH